MFWRSQYIFVFLLCVACIENSTHGQTKSRSNDETNVKHDYSGMQDTEKQMSPLGSTTDEPINDGNTMSDIRAVLEALRLEVRASRYSMEGTFATRMSDVNIRMEKLVSEVKGEIGTLKMQVRSMNEICLGEDSTVHTKEEKTDEQVNETIEDLETLGIDVHEPQGEVRNRRNTRAVKMGGIMAEMKSLKVYQESVRENIKFLKDELIKNVRDLRAKNQLVIGQVRRVTEEVLNVKNTVMGDAAKLEKIQMQVVAGNGGIQRLGDGIKVIQDEVVGTKYQVKLVQDQVKMSKYELVVVQDQVNLAKYHVVVARQKVTSLADRIKNVQREMGALKDSIKGVRGELIGAAGSMMNVQATVASKFKVVEIKLKGLRDGRNRALVDLKHMKKQINGVSIRVESTRYVLDGMKQYVTNINKQMFQVSDQVKKVHDAIQHMNSGEMNSTTNIDFEEMENTTDVNDGKSGCKLDRMKKYVTQVGKYVLQGISETKTVQDKMKSNSARANAQMNYIRDQVKNVHNAIRQMNTSTTSHITMVGNQVYRLDMQSRGTRANLIRITDGVKEMKGELDDIKIVSNELIEKTNDYQLINTEKKSIDDIKGQVKNVHDAIQQIKVSTRTQIKSVGDQIVQLNVQSNGAKDKLVQINGGVNKIKEDLNNIKIVSDELISKTNICDSRISGIAPIANNIGNQVKKVHDAIQHMNKSTGAQIKMVGDQVVRLDVQSKETKAKLNEIKDEVNEVKDELGDMKILSKDLIDMTNDKSIDNMRDEIKMVHETIKHINTSTTAQIKIVGDQVFRLDKQSSESNAKVIQITNRVKEIKGDLDDIKIISKELVNKTNEYQSNSLEMKSIDNMRNQVKTVHDAIQQMNLTTKAHIKMIGDQVVGLDKQSKGTETKLTQIGIGMKDMKKELKDVKIATDILINKTDVYQLKKSGKEAKDSIIKDQIKKVHNGIQHINQSMVTDIKKVRDQVAQINAQLSGTKAKLIQINDGVKEMKGELNDIKVVSDEVNNKTEVCQSRGMTDDVIRDQVQKINEGIQHMNQSTRAQIKTVGEQVVLLNVQSSGTEKKLSHINEGMKVIKDELDTIKVISNKVFNKTNDYQLIRGQVKKVHTDIKQINTSTRAQIQMVVGQFGQLGVQSNGAKTKLIQINAGMNEIKAELDELKITSKKLKNNTGVQIINSEKQLIHNIRDQVKKVHEAIRYMNTSTRSQIKMVVDRIARLDDYSSGSKTRLTQINNDIEEIKGEINNVRITSNELVNKTDICQTTSSGNLRINNIIRDQVKKIYDAIQNINISTKAQIKMVGDQVVQLNVQSIGTKTKLTQIDTGMNEIKKELYEIKVTSKELTNNTAVCKPGNSEKKSMDIIRDQVKNVHDAIQYMNTSTRLQIKMVGDRVVQLDDYSSGTKAKLTQMNIDIKDIKREMYIMKIASNELINKTDIYQSKNAGKMWINNVIKNQMKEIYDAIKNINTSTRAQIRMVGDQLGMQSNGTKTKLTQINAGMHEIKKELYEIKVTSKELSNSTAVGKFRNSEKKLIYIIRDQVKKVHDAIQYMNTSTRLQIKMVGDRVVQLDDYSSGIKAKLTQMNNDITDIKREMYIMKIASNELINKTDIYQSKNAGKMWIDSVIKNQMKEIYDGIQNIKASTRAQIEMVGDQLGVQSNATKAKLTQINARIHEIKEELYEIKVTSKELSNNTAVCQTKDSEKKSIDNVRDQVNKVHDAIQYMNTSSRLQIKMVADQIVRLGDYSSGSKTKLTQINSDIKEIKGEINKVRIASDELINKTDICQNRNLGKTLIDNGIRDQVKRLYHAIYNMNMSTRAHIKMVGDEVVQLDKQSIGTKNKLTQINEGVKVMRDELDNIKIISKELLNQTNNYQLMNSGKISIKDIRDQIKNVHEAIQQMNRSTRTEMKIVGNQIVQLDAQSSGIKERLIQINGGMKEMNNELEVIKKIASEELINKTNSCQSMQFGKQLIENVKNQVKKMRVAVKNMTTLTTTQIKAIGDRIVRIDKHSSETTKKLHQINDRVNGMKEELDEINITSYKLTNRTINSNKNSISNIRDKMTKVHEAIQNMNTSTRVQIKMVADRVVRLDQHSNGAKTKLLEIKDGVEEIKEELDDIRIVSIEILNKTDQPMNSGRKSIDDIKDQVKKIHDAVQHMNASTRRQINMVGDQVSRLDKQSIGIKTKLTLINDGMKDVKEKLDYIKIASDELIDKTNDYQSVNPRRKSVNNISNQVMKVHKAIQQMNASTGAQVKMVENQIARLNMQSGGIKTKLEEINDGVNDMITGLDDMKIASDELIKTTNHYQSMNRGKMSLDNIKDQVKKIHRVVMHMNTSTIAQINTVCEQVVKLDEQSTGTKAELQNIHNGVKEIKVELDDVKIASEELIDKINESQLMSSENKAGIKEQVKKVHDAIRHMNTSTRSQFKMVEDHVVRLDELSGGTKTKLLQINEGMGKMKEDLDVIMVASEKLINTTEACLSKQPRKKSIDKVTLTWTLAGGTESGDRFMEIIEDNSKLDLLEKEPDREILEIENTTNVLEKEVEKEIEIIKNLSSVQEVELDNETMKLMNLIKNNTGTSQKKFSNEAKDTTNITPQVINEGIQIKNISVEGDHKAFYDNKTNRRSEVELGWKRNLSGLRNTTDTYSGETGAETGDTVIGTEDTRLSKNSFACVKEDDGTKTVLKDIKQVLSDIKQELVVFRTGNIKNETAGLKTGMFKSRKVLRRELEQLTTYGIRTCKQMLYVFGAYSPLPAKMIDNKGEDIEMMADIVRDLIRK